MRCHAQIHSNTWVWVKNQISTNNFKLGRWTSQQQHHVCIYIYIMNTDLCNVGLHLFIVTLLWGQVPRNTYVGSWGSTEVSWRKPWKRWSHWTASAVAKNELVKGRWLWFSKCDTVRYPWLLPSSMVLWKAILSARSPRFSMSLSQGLFFPFCAERTTLFVLIYTPGHLNAVEQKKIFWHEESIVLQLSFFWWYQTVGNHVVPTRNGWSRSWVPGEDPKRTWRNYSWMWEICVLADVDVLFFNLKDVQTGIFRWKPSRKIKNMLNS